jgi:glycosyltransferase involved in cell wall biosynthesis
MAKSLKILMSAFVCRPGLGSEGGVGWNTAREAARNHEVWLVTCASSRPWIEPELARNPVLTMHPIYWDLPGWARRLIEREAGSPLHYHLWQIGAYGVFRQLHREIGFDVTHHVTYCKYWAPSLLAFLPVPFLWGPVGGGESWPRTFRSDLSLRGKAYEAVRDLARWCGEKDPLVLSTAQRSAFGLGVTVDTAKRMRALGARHVAIYSQLGLSKSERFDLERLPDGSSEPVRFVSMGRVLHLKGFHLGLKAFAAAALPGSEYWVVGSGPELANLKRLARDLGIAERVQFLGELSRCEALATLAECHVLVHPSLHDSGGLVCLEAMAAGRPVICLDLGGPATQVTESTGIKVPARNPKQAVRDLAAAMTTLATDPDLRSSMGQAGRQRAAGLYAWERKGESLSALYEALADGGSPQSIGASRQFTLVDAGTMNIEPNRTQA